MDPNHKAHFYFGRCTRCDKEVCGAGRACRAMGRLFHDTCFTCCVCTKKLAGKPFYSTSGGIYCEEDFLYSGAHPSPEVCDSCGFLISDLLLQARGKSYHPSCFRCVVCRQSLEGLPFAVDSRSRVYCVTDYHSSLVDLASWFQGPGSLV
ncbi:LIM domain-containing protein 1 isoform X2 [Betta splendens]|uniref:LIM domain-containing protein 1 n=1 Tax=Betta splendens TaxID=158456 RepID=A0A6P7NTJ8_BETSP|nr:LIM domain-containing protein 1 isoform X2 [Betta splendens]